MGQGTAGESAHDSGLAKCLCLGTADRLSTVMHSKSVMEREGAFALEGTAEHACRAWDGIPIPWEGKTVYNCDVSRVKGISVNSAIRKLKASYIKCG